MVERVRSVDVLRGLTILTMVFVNDVGPGAPAWSKHIQPPDADGMTLADTVFPAFLFIVGMSIPLAMGRARQKGATTFQLVRHVITRGFSLLLMGLILLNHQSDTRLPENAWGWFAILFLVLAWSVVPANVDQEDASKSSRKWRRNLIIALKSIGVIGLLCMLVIFRRQPVQTELFAYGKVTDWIWLTTGWWGILGLIGWAYMTSALVYLLLGKRREWLVAATSLLMVLFVADREGGVLSGFAEKSWTGPLRPVIQTLHDWLVYVDSYVDFGTTLGSLPAITMAGCVLGTLLVPGYLGDSSDKIRWACTYATLLFIAGVLADPIAGINKIAATPTWCMWCAGLTTLVWCLLYWLIDVRNADRFVGLVAPAGANPLIAYLLHPFLLWTLTFAGVSDLVLGYKSSDSGMVCMVGSLIMAIVVCALTGLIARSGLRVRI